MRPGAEYTVRPGAAAAAAPTVSPATNATAHSPWQSPVPYLFGGLAAMLGLIAFALLILACSYWKLSGYLDGAGDDQAGSGGRAGGADEKASAAGAAKPAAEFREHVVVIMAGDEKPTFLAMPASSRAGAEPGAEPVVGGSGGSEASKKTEEESAVSLPSLQDGAQNPSDDRAASAAESQQ